MKYIKIILILLLVWPKFWYDRVARNAEEEWKKEGERSPLYSDKTKKLIKKQKRAKGWALLMSIIPFGPISMFVTWLSFRSENERTIEYQVSQQIPEIEKLKELGIKRRETFIKYLDEKFKADKDINWENILLDNERAKQIEEFLFGENGVLVREPEKNNNTNNNNDEEKIEELNI